MKNEERDEKALSWEDAGALAEASLLEMERRRSALAEREAAAYDEPDDRCTELTCPHHGRRNRQRRGELW